MLGTLEVVELDDPRAKGFQAIADGVTWYGERPPDLCAVMDPRGLGSLALSARPNMARLDAPADIRALIFFYDRETGTRLLPVPRSIDDFCAVTGREPSLQDPDMAKGVGVLGGNSPRALASHYAVHTFAMARLVHVDGMHDVYTGDEDLGIIGGLRRHGRLWGGAEAEDAADPTGNMPGTRRAIEDRAEQLGGKTCAIVPLSPLNRAWQEGGLVPGRHVRGAHVLVNGRAAEPQGGLESLGSASIPRPFGPMRVIMPALFGLLPG